MYDNVYGIMTIFIKKRQNLTDIAKLIKLYVFCKKKQLKCNENVIFISWKE